MELSNLFKLLLRHRFTLIIIPMIAAALTYLLVWNMPESYTSRSRIATGIIDGSSTLLSGKDIQESQSNLEFENFIQTIFLKKVVNQVSYQLMLHDLNSKSPFTKPTGEFRKLSATDRKEASLIFLEKYKQMEELSSTGKEGNLYKLMTLMHYDNDNLHKNLLVSRVSNSDFIDLQYNSENPDLSAFVLNTLFKEFLTYYSGNLRHNNYNAVYFLDSLLKTKQAALQKKMANLQNYKVKNGILDVDNQASILIGQIADFESKRQEAYKNIGSYKGALASIDSKFNPNDRKYFESSVTSLNQDILLTKSRLNSANNDYIKNNFDPKYKGKIDTLQGVLASQLNKVNDSYLYNPASGKQELVAQKLNLEVSLELAKNSVASLNTELSRLNGRLYKLVPDQAAIKTLQDDITIAATEYTELSKKYEQANMDAGFTVKIRQVEMARPGTPQPSKKILLVAIAGVASFVFCIVVLFILFYLDNSINSCKELANRTKQPVLGELNLLNQSKLNMGNLWNDSDKTMDLRYFKNLLRSIRFEIDNELNDAKIIAVTSLKTNEGKTFFALNLAYAYAQMNRKVLLIDGNFHSAEITKILKPALYLEDYLLSNEEAAVITALNNNPAILGNKGGDRSLLELSSRARIEQKLEDLKNNFDIIIVEAPALDKLDKAREWMMFADKVIPVFGAAQTISAGQKQEVEYLGSLNGKLTGWILNKVPFVNKVPVKGRKVKTANA